MRRLLLVLLFVLIYPSVGWTAIGQASLTADKTTANASSYTTLSITPTANRLVIAVIVNPLSAGTASTPTLSGNGLTWVQINTQLTSDNVQRITMFRTMGASPSAGIVTIDFGGINQSGCAWSIYEFSDVDTSGTNGSGAVVQNGINSGTGASGSVTLLAFGDATNNAASSGWGLRRNTAVTEESGWTEITEQSFNTPETTLETQWRIGQDTSPTASWVPTDVIWGGIAIEIKVAPAGTSPDVWMFGE